MGRCCQLVMGPAGSGKSTYCNTIMNHCITKKRKVHLVNLDPAAEVFEYEPTIDIRELITLEDVMEELEMGPNGGLIYCLDYFLEQEQWFEEEIGDYEDDYLLIDCPGQIEIYTHYNIIGQLVEKLQRLNFKVVGIYCLDSQFIVDKYKFFSGVMSAMSTMINIEIPYINVLTKMDLLGEGDEELLQRYLDVDPTLLLDDNDKSIGVKGGFTEKFHSLNLGLVQLIEDQSLVSFIPLNNTDEDSVEYILSYADNAIQYGEDLEPEMPKEMEEDMEDYE